MDLSSDFLLKVSNSAKSRVLILEEALSFNHVATIIDSYSNARGKTQIRSLTSHCSSVPCTSSCIGILLAL